MSRIRGSQWTTLFQTPATDLLHSFGLWSASITYDRDEWQLQAYGENLAGKVYAVGQSGAGANPDNNIFGNPRQFGIRVMRSF